MAKDNVAYSGRKPVGRYITDEQGVWLQKQVDPAKHQLKVPPAWAIDTAHIEELTRRHGVGVRLFLTTGEVLEATLEDFAQWGFDIKRGNYEPQFALALSRWTNPMAEEEE